MISSNEIYLTAPDWSKKEVLILTRSFLKCSTHVSKNTNRNKEDLWRDIKEVYDSLCSSADISVRRETSALAAKWAPIQTDIHKFVAYARRAHNERQGRKSGETQEDFESNLLEEAQILWAREKEGKQFKWEAEYRAVWHEPKYSFVTTGSAKTAQIKNKTEMTTPKRDIETVETPSAEDNMAWANADTPRPSGIKKIKREEAKERTEKKKLDPVLAVPFSKSSNSSFVKVYIPLSIRSVIIILCNIMTQYMTYIMSIGLDRRDGAQIYLNCF